MTFKLTLDNTEISQTSIEITAITINCQALQLDDEKFFQLCQDNQELRFERNANGDLIIMPPTGGETGNRNIEIAYQLQAWSRQNQWCRSFPGCGVDTSRKME